MIAKLWLWCHSAFGEKNGAMRLDSRRLFLRSEGRQSEGMARVDTRPTMRFPPCLRGSG